MSVNKISKWNLILCILSFILVATMVSAVSADTVYSKGPDTAKVTIIEFTDFQCPFCARANVTIQQLLKEYPNDIKLIYRSNPLPNHLDAPLAAEAALAAGAQGKFWEMHDLLFTNQKALKKSDLITYAKTLKLDIGQFQKSLNSREFQKQVELDAAFGKMLRVSGTPTFFINGNKVVGAKPYAEFKNMIDTLLAGKELPKAAPEKPNTPPVPVTDLKPNLSGVLNAKGLETAPITIVEYSDFQCPFCNRVVPTLDKLYKTYPDKIRIIFKQYPLSFHKDARPAAKAALAAGRQGKFWEMYDMLFKNQSAWAGKANAKETFSAYAKDLGLNVTQFQTDSADKAIRARVESDTTAGLLAGINATPTFYLNGKQISPQSPDELKTLVATAIKGTK
jgi:protein-disulfide isomerase